jgi:hypothetical protein
VSYLASIAALAIVLATLAYGGRVAYATTEGLMLGFARGAEGRAEILLDLGFLAALYGLLLNRDLTEVGVLLIGLGILVEPAKDRAARPYEAAFLAVALAALAALAICRLAKHLLV